MSVLVGAWDTYVKWADRKTSALDKCYKQLGPPQRICQEKRAGIYPALLRFVCGVHLERIFLGFAPCIKELLRDFENNRRQCQQRDQVWYRHHRVQRIRNKPDKCRVHRRTTDYGQ